MFEYRIEATPTSRWNDGKIRSKDEPTMMTVLADTHDAAIAKAKAALDRKHPNANFKDEFAVVGVVEVP